MAGRIRTIKPEVLDDELACALTDLAWRVWVSLWVLCDDFGNVRASPKYIAAQVWQDSGRINDAMKALEELSTKTVDPGQKPMIFMYGADGQTYAHIKGFDKHQRQDNRSKKPRVPAPPEGAEAIQDLRRHLAAKTRKSPRGKSVCTAPPRSGDHDPMFAALTSDLRDPTTDRLPPTTDPSSPAVCDEPVQSSLLPDEPKPEPTPTSQPAEPPPEPKPPQPEPPEPPKATEPHKSPLPVQPNLLPPEPPEPPGEPGPPKEPEEAKPKTAHQIVKECYCECFEAVRHEIPPFGSKDGKAINTLLEKVSGDAERACGVIRAAFANKFWQSRVSIQIIALDPAKYGDPQLSLHGVMRKKDPSDWVPTDDPAREEALREGPRQGKAF